MNVPRIFFSYSRSDADFALKLATDLRNAGANLWIDQLDIGPGDTWDLEVQKALEGCGSILVILSEASVASENVLDEVYYALDEGKKVVPVLINACKVPFRLKRLQYIDLSSSYAQGFANLLSSLELPNRTGNADAAVLIPDRTLTGIPGKNVGESGLAKKAGGKVILQVAITVLAFSVCTWLGFLLNLSPPDPGNELSFPVIIAQFLFAVSLLFIFFFLHQRVSAGKIDKGKYARWRLYIGGVLIVLSVISAVLYYQNFKRYTITQDNWKLRFIKGDSLTADSKQICLEENSGGLTKDCERYLLDNFYSLGDIITKKLLWTKESVDAATSRLLINYIFLLAGISGLLFLSIDGLFFRPAV